MNGWMDLPALRGAKYTIYGGPYRERVSAMVGVKLTSEKWYEDLQADIACPMPDFGLPNKEDLYAALSRVIDAMIEGKAVYVGCGFGQGRTGLFLAALAKAWGVKEPVKFVREEYYPKAVETLPQEQFIADLRFPKKLLAKVLWAKVHGLWMPGGLLTAFDPTWFRPRALAYRPAGYVTPGKGQA